MPPAAEYKLGSSAETRVGDVTLLFRCTFYSILTSLDNTNVLTVTNGERMLLCLGSVSFEKERTLASDSRTSKLVMRMHFIKPLLERLVYILGMDAATL